MRGIYGNVGAFLMPIFKEGSMTKQIETVEIQSVILKVIHADGTASVVNMAPKEFEYNCKNKELLIRVGISGLINTDATVIKSERVIGNISQADTSKIDPNKINWDDYPKEMTPV